MPREIQPPSEFFDQLKKEKAEKKARKEEAARATFEMNQQLGIEAAPKEIKKRYPLLEKLEQDARKRKNNLELFNEQPGASK
ncbi:MAG: hypothetical protein ABIJ81_03345 [Patescibacteria group bacterium]